VFVDAILIYLEKKGAIVPFPVKKKKRRQQPLLSPVVPFARGVPWPCSDWKNPWKK
jgi:hypothetical protein